MNSAATQVIRLRRMDILELELHPARQLVFRKADCRLNILEKVRVVNVWVETQSTDTPAGAKGQAIPECVTALDISSVRPTGIAIYRHTIPE